jgi:pyruvate formate lyase activating enzyme
MTASSKQPVSGIVFNIQRFSVHDGPGIRTTAFLKGCPLRCRWCHNPEGINPEPEIMRRDQTAETAGRTMTAQAVANELARDRIFYEESGGGITLSGGEPLSQPEFAIEILRLCKEAGLHTALDTCGFAEPAVLLAAAPFTGLFLYDFKHPDSAKHEEFTDVPNDLIISNLKMLCAKGCDVLVRQPVIPGFNDAPETVEKTGRVLATCGIKRLQLLPYHALGTSKRRRLITDISAGNFTPPTHQQLLAIQSILGKFPFEIILGE